VWGRESLVKEILSYFSSTESNFIISICGPAGYGKTEVARQISLAALEHNLFTDILWITAREAEFYNGKITSDRQKPLDWKQFLYELSCQLDCTPEQIKVQRHLRKSPYLIVLDNAETSRIEDIISRLTKMLKPSRLLLTTRFEVGYPIRKIECPGLTEKSTNELLLHEARLRSVEALIYASDQQLNKIYDLSCGAPLALHFVVGRATEDKDLSPVLLSLEQANRDVEYFYEFTLKSGWDRISGFSKHILHYMSQADASVATSELLDLLELIDNNSKADLTFSNIKSELRRWGFILEMQDSNKILRYDLHPWLRRSIRSGLVGKWNESFEDFEKIIRRKYSP
jgi:hypothetical protein